MAVQSGFTKDDVSMTFTGSITSEDSGAGFGPGDAAAIYGIDWDQEKAAIVVQRTPGGPWVVAVPFMVFDYLETP